MPRRSRRLGAPTLALLIVTALLAMMSLVPAGADAATTTPTPTPSGSSSPTGAPGSKVPTVTFGVGPSNGKYLDGRPYFSYAASPGTTITDHFAIANISNQTLDLLVYGVDATTSSDGQLSYQSHAAPLKATGAWLATPLFDGTNDFPVKGRSTLNLPFQLRIPRNASPGDHTAGLAVGLIAKVQGKSTKNLNFEQRVVAKVYVRVSGTPVASLQVKDLQANYSGSLNPVGTGSTTITYTVVNNGNVDLGAKQQVTVSGLFGSTGSSPKVPEFDDLVPGSSTKVKVVVHGVLPTFLLSAKVKLTPLALPNAVDPPLHVVSTSTTVWAIPWAFLVLIVILVAAGYGLRKYIAHRRATRPQARHGRAKAPAAVASEI